MGQSNNKTGDCSVVVGVPINANVEQQYKLPKATELEGVLGRTTKTQKSHYSQKESGNLVKEAVKMKLFRKFLDNSTQLEKFSTLPESTKDIKEP